MFFSDPEIQTRRLNESDKKYLQKAIQFYLFTRQLKITELPEPLQPRFTHSGNVAYSLILTYLKEDEFKPEYMQFINDELNELRNAAPDLLEPLIIKPHEIDEIELNSKVLLVFTDIDNETVWRMEYEKEDGILKFGTE
jgi:hypothetical protein